MVSISTSTVSERIPTRDERLPAWALCLLSTTALPALARMLKGLPAGLRGVAVIEVAGPGGGLTAPDGVELRWVHRDGAAPGTSDGLAAAVLAVVAPAGGPRARLGRRGVRVNQADPPVPARRAGPRPRGSRGHWLLEVRCRRLRRRPRRPGVAGPGARHHRPGTRPARPRDRIGRRAHRTTAPPDRAGRHQRPPVWRR
ncbi:hypothetical protein DMP17_44780 [Pseudonocardia sp. TMWB2A]